MKTKNKEQKEHDIEMHNRKERLREEIKYYEAEKEKIRKDIGELGGAKFSSKDLITNMVFAILLLSLLFLQAVFKILPDFISLELAIFLVSAKIMLMIYSQHKHNHFMFWVLNTMEYRLNTVEKSIKNIEKMLSRD